MTHADCFVWVGLTVSPPLSMFNTPFSTSSLEFSHPPSLKGETSFSPSLGGAVRPHEHVCVCRVPSGHSQRERALLKLRMITPLVMRCGDHDSEKTVY